MVGHKSLCVGCCGSSLGCRRSEEPHKRSMPLHLSHTGVSGGRPVSEHTDPSVPGQAAWGNVS